MNLKDIKPVATLGGEKLYSAEQMQEYAISFGAFALKEGEPIDLVTSDDYQKHAEELFKKFEEAQDEEV
ncbi:hypothetical protein [Lactococcus petauri]|uniref:hypothetical protein n=1 Tax=Lactococcus petauri TaxID=1940789 RepID=UPI0022E73804|nr:hypothetical protein [Lactococcus petauri]